MLTTVLLEAALVTTTLLAAPAHNQAPMPGEIDEAHRWAAAKFEGRLVEAKPAPGLEVRANYGPVQPDARSGEPIKIGGKTYARGLYCHATSEIVVRLPKPAKQFTAEVGIDARANGGSIDFSVEVGGKETYRSGVMRFSDAARPVKVDLGGAAELTLKIGDGGDGYSCDQGDWADAKVLLADGSTLWLSDLPIRQPRTAYTADPPFSFALDGRPSSDLLAAWKCERSLRPLDSNRTEHTVTYTDPASALVVRCVAVEYRDFPTVEWTVYLRNDGKADSPLVTAFRSLDTRIGVSTVVPPTLHHWTGTLVNRHDYEPHDSTLERGKPMELTSREGRPCAGVFPYFNLDWGNEGVLEVVGWPGKWTATFEAGADGLALTAGQETTHFRLHPGEEVRSPLMVLQFWQGDTVRAQNVWRRWMFAHGMPRRNGKLPEPQMPAVSGNQFPGLLCAEAGEFQYLDRFKEERIPITHWWMDAGWYPNKGDWGTTGTWEIDTKRFPRGIRSIADKVHADGKQLIVWFEPERVTAGSWLADNHPEWVLGGKDGGLLDLGNPDAWKWLVETYDGLITEQGIDYYRQDFNMDPLPYWRSHDADDRQGITENKHVQGYLAFWDELVRRHPSMMIDSCASGGHRNDLETLRRSVPLLRSDYIFDPVGEQCHTYGFASWVPYWGTGFIDYDLYIARGCYGMDTTLGMDARRKDLDWSLLRRICKEWREVVHCFEGDYYPLTTYTVAEDQWIGWQFNRPDLGEGIVQVFRRGKSVYESVRLQLRGVDPKATYVVTDADEGKPRRMTGESLMEPGLLVKIGSRPGSALVRYKVAK